jgi:type IV secretion system protein VirB3
VTDLRSDPLFGGLTRPATVLGLPIEALIGIVGSSAVGFLVANMFRADVTWKVGALGMGVVFYGLARLLCARDPRAFRYLSLQLTTKAVHRQRAYWRSGSYAPLRARKRH